MKYYIYSPIGRTGSKRIFNPLADTITAEVGDSSRFTIHGDNFRCTLLKRDQSNIEHDISILDTWQNSVAVHSHNCECIPRLSSGWKFILSSRKRKIDAVLSKLVAKQSDIHHPKQLTKRKREKLCPFEVSELEVSGLLEKYIAGEFAFVEKVKSLGAIPIVIYMEDSFDTIQEKLDKQFNKATFIHDIGTISNLKAVDYITNYDEIQAMYDENLTDYQKRFYTETE